MTRRKDLTNILEQHLLQDKQGSLRARKNRLRLMGKIVDDLINIKRLPITWFALNQTHVLKLVTHWKERGLQFSTIMNYLAALRYFLKKIGHNILLNNKNLGLQKTKNSYQSPICTQEILEKINHPLVKILFELQTDCGLTFSEAIKLVPNIHIQDTFIYLTREISVNGKDRMIPIESENQRMLLEKLENFLRPNKNLLAHYQYAKLRGFYQKNLKPLGLPTNIQYRYLYAKSRFKTLFKKMNVHDAKTQLIQEMQINKTSPIWKIIYE